MREVVTIYGMHDIFHLVAPSSPTKPLAPTGNLALSVILDSLDCATEYVKR